MALTKQERRIRIKHRIRKRMSGTKEIPRMTVFRSNKQIYVQFVDDVLEAHSLKLLHCQKNLPVRKA
jgi:ribosomal protein L18